MAPGTNAGLMPEKPVALRDVTVPKITYPVSTVDGKIRVLASIPPESKT